MQHWSRQSERTCLQQPYILCYGNSIFYQLLKQGTDSHYWPSRECTASVFACNIFCKRKAFLQHYIWIDWKGVRQVTRIDMHDKIGALSPPPAVMRLEFVSLNAIDQSWFTRFRHTLEVRTFNGLFGRLLSCVRADLSQLKRSFLSRIKRRSKLI